MPILAREDEAMTTPQTFSVSVLLHKDGDAWVAQCIERDVAAQGRTADEAKQRFLNTLADQILLDMATNKEPLVHLNPAPSRYAMRNESSGPTLPTYVPVTKEPRMLVLVTQRGETRGTATFLEEAAA